MNVELRRHDLLSNLTGFRAAMGCRRLAARPGRPLSTFLIIFGRSGAAGWLAESLMTMQPG